MSTSRFYCTYFDHRYLSRGLALYRSMTEHCMPFELWVLCMDHTCYRVLDRLGLPHVHLIALESLEQGDEALFAAKQDRSLVEYYFTCTPSLPLYVLRNWPEVDLLTYVDADLFFFADPAPIYSELAGQSVGIIEHRFAPHLQQRERYGRYNVGWLSFRRSEPALACLRWWRDRCNEWCYDRYDGDRFADQKYLDAWPSLFNGVHIVQHKGANVAPWNLGRYLLRADGGRVLVDDAPLIFYHFHGVKQISDALYDPGLFEYRVPLSRVLRNDIYEPYVQALAEAGRHLSPYLEDSDLDSLRGRRHRSWHRSVARTLWEAFHLSRLMLTHGYIASSQAGAK